MFFTSQRVTPSHFLSSGPDLSFCWANSGPGPYVWHRCNNRNESCIHIRASEMLFLSLCKRWRYRKSTEKNRQTSNVALVVTCDEPGGQAVVQLLFVVSERLVCHDLEIEDEHDHHAILVLHWHHIHHTQDALACRGQSSRWGRLRWHAQAARLGLKLISNYFTVVVLLEQHQSTDKSRIQSEFKLCVMTLWTST